ncbi:recombination-associated protein RdgC [Pectobacterium brasiliense]|uniref:recombination-associated protein RdgC n=1 Tax=Pectobacterium brasiliense TaxID=180957 RepID=UPI000CE68714|nr:recombination-associated protein RdgC [Pectobacterium brasiliense]PPE61911.1 recombination-associated protein RdgC [Pectobacterium brasiliense]
MSVLSFKNAIIYRLSRGVDLSKLAEQMQVFAFTPCGSNDMQKMGWVPPLPTGDVLAHQVGDQIIVTVQREEKIIPSPVIKRELAAKIERMELEQHRKLKKTEKDSIKDEVLHTLLPRAFSKFQKTQVWIDNKSNLIIVDAASARKAEDALALLRKTLGSLPVVPLTMESPIELTLTEWVRNGAVPQGFGLRDEAELKAILEDGGILRSKKQDLISSEIAGHIEAGKLVTKLALEWQEKISFVLTDDGVLKKLKLSDSVLEQNDDIDREDINQRFEADFVLITGELSALIKNLIEVLGGEASR